MAAVVSSALVTQHKSDTLDGATPGERVRRARVRQGLTQKQLATLADVSLSTIKNLENDVAPTRRVAEGVAVALKTTSARLGYEFPERVTRLRDLTDSQREALDMLLALPPEEVARVREALRLIWESRGREGKK